MDNIASPWPNYIHNISMSVSMAKYSVEGGVHAEHIFLSHRTPASVTTTASIIMGGCKHFAFASKVERAAALVRQFLSGYSSYCNLGDGLGC
jgi:hypothetical protein